MEIKAKNIQVGYGDSIVIEEMDIHLKKGEITTVMGQMVLENLLY